jgi:hypothetical protein
MNAIAAGEGGWLAIASNYETFLPLLWTSPDGRSWTQQTVSGLDEPADILSVTSAPAGLLAAGYVRQGPDPGSGPFAPAIWASADGRKWDRLTIEGSSGFLTGIVAVDGRLIAVGMIDDQAAVLASDDGGASWTRSDPDEGFGGINGVAANGSTVVATSYEANEDGTGIPVVLRSTNGGGTWVEVNPDPLLLEGIDWLPRPVVAAARFWLPTARLFDPWAEPERCYEDVRLCAAPTPTLLASADGIEWEQVDTAGMQLGQNTSFSAVIDGLGGGIHVVGADEGPVVWSWTKPDIPIRPLVEAAPSTGPPVVSFDAILEKGQAYRYPLSTHCGTEYLGRFNGKNWFAVATFGPADGSQPESWPVANQFILGLVTLVADNQIEYSLPSGDVVAIYEPRNEEPLMCM